MLIDLYRIFYKIHEPVYREQKALPSNKTDTAEEQTIKDYPLKDGYIIPLNKYASRGDFDTLQQAVNIGRQQVYQALISFREAAKR